MAENIYDIAIVGGGPAGLTAGLYSRRAAMNTLLLERYLPGGQVLLTEKIDNYPGFPDGVAGLELISRMKEQALKIGLPIAQDTVDEIKEENGQNKYFELITGNGNKYKALSVILATGAMWKQLGVAGEDKFTGRGVSYCATCDAPIFRNKKVVVVGGGDKAVEEAMYLTKFASEVVLIHRRDRLRATAILQKDLLKNKKISLALNSVVTCVEGDKVVNGVKVKNVLDGKENNISCSGVFIFVGITPNSQLLKDRVKMDERGYIITDDDMRTSEEGVFACGDVRRKSLAQVIVAAGEGAQAAMSAQKYAEKLKGNAY